MSKFDEFDGNVRLFANRPHDEEDDSGPEESRVDFEGRFIPHVEGRGPYENAAEMFQRDFQEATSGRGGWKNLAVFAAVALVLLPLFIWGTSWFRSAPDKHFLVGVPLCSLEVLVPLKGDVPAPSDDEVAQKCVLVMLWGPWDDASGSHLATLAPYLEKAEATGEFRFVPVAYFQNVSAESELSDLSDKERAALLEQQEGLLRSVNRVFTVLGIHFSSVWWDPLEQFRKSQSELAFAVKPEVRGQADGFGFPTFILVRNGVIQNVWSGRAPENLPEIGEQLKLIAAGGATLAGQ